MKTISITPKQLGLVVLCSTSIPLVAFVLGFIFSTHQTSIGPAVAIQVAPATDKSLSANELAETEAPATQEVSEAAGAPEPMDNTVSTVNSLLTDDVVQTGIPLSAEDRVINETLDTEIATIEILPPLEDFEVTDIATADEEPAEINEASSVEFVSEDETTTSENMATELATQVEVESNTETEVAALETSEPTSAKQSKPVIAETTLPPYALQVGVFSNKTGAIEWALSLEKTLPNIQVFTRKNAKGDMMYSVVTGLFEDKDHAKASGKQLSKRHQMNYYVTGSDSFGHEIFVANTNFSLAGNF